MDVRPSAEKDTPESPPGDDACLLLEAGHPLFLRHGQDERWGQAGVVGLKPGEFLIVRPPQPIFTKAQTRAEVPVEVRLEREGVLYGFSSSLLSAVKHPGPFLFLSYPKNFAVKVLRRHQRVKCLLPAMVEADGLSLAGHLRDISLGGCRVSVPAAEATQAAELALGADVEVRLPLSGLDVKELSGQVRLFRREGERVTLGIGFREDVAVRSAVERFLRELAQVETLCLRTASPAPPPGLKDIRSGMDEATVSVEDARQVELRTQKPLEFQFTGSHLFESATILGVDGSRTVIAGMPLNGGLRNCPKPGMGLRARFEEHGSYYGFMTSVTRFVTRPCPLVFFSYPKKIEVLVRRKHARVRCHLPVRLENEHMSACGYITDISQGGCRVVANLDDGECVLNVMTGDALTVSLPLDGLLVETLKAKVKTVRMAGGAATLGLVFSLDKDLAGRLCGFMNRLEAAGDSF